ncbi:hypothetical protein DLJ49_03525 [Rhodovulum sp. 12E13]|uniref:hypothetical protein n=1 Tax=Rhodovulum sp. 12E13 TaxID=2203891 RepID=UPI000E11B7E7|nr:hypothetical protein [Rhodovulum sp. 12E13]RDC74376.1 hypothetical protein DLJ49_03525 [Rhodovulum sp. 12E13]
MATLTATRPVPHSVFAPFRALGRFIVMFRGAGLAAAEVESLSRLPDEALAARGLSRSEIVPHAMRHLDI